MVLNLIKFLIGFIAATFLFWVGLIYDRLPAGWPNFHTGFFGIVLHAPGAGAVTAADAKWAGLVSQEAAATIRAARIAVEQEAATRTAQAAQIGIQTRIVTQTNTVLKEVPIYVTPTTDQRFPLPWGFIRLHDAAASGVDVSLIALPAGSTDDTASGITASTTISVIANNYGKCREDDAELKGWQDWYSQIQAAGQVK